jgi:peroxiredoxin
LAAQEQVKSKGIDEVIIVCINDGAVMSAWADAQNCGQDGEGSMLNMLADPHGRFTDAMGLRLTHEGPAEIFGQGRSKRYSAFFDNGVLKELNLAELPDDPAGDDVPDNSLVDAMMRTPSFN